MLRAIIYTNYLIMYEQTHAHIKIIRTINYKIHKQYQILLMSAFQFLIVETRTYPWQSTAKISRISSP